MEKLLSGQTRHFGESQEEIHRKIQRQISMVDFRFVLQNVFDVPWIRINLKYFLEFLQMKCMLQSALFFYERMITVAISQLLNYNPFNND